MNKLFGPLGAGEDVAYLQRKFIELIFSEDAGESDPGDLAKLNSLALAIFRTTAFLHVGVKDHA